MRKFVLFFVALFVCFYANAQLSTNEMPPSFSLKEDNAVIKTISLEKPDLTKVIEEDESDESLFKMRRFGVILKCGKDFFEHADVTTNEKGKIYRLAVEVPEAQALIFYSDRFVLPKGGKLFLYNEDRSKVLGAFSYFNNHQLKTFATEYLEGEKIIFEYFEPNDLREKAQIEITEIGYAYRDIPEKASDEYRSSGSCNVNVNCSEGDDYRKQQRAVARIQVRMSQYYIGWCTGTLVNNTSYDRKPYLLTAAHCIEDVASTSYYSQFVFVFKYETSGCSTPASEPSRSKSLTGATLKAYDNTYSGGGSDFCLFLLNNDVPESYNPFWCGWDNRNNAVSKGVSIHHPSGDVKKISTFNSRLQSATFSSNSSSSGTHWVVKWVETENGYGVTEGGSSGSALFNEYGQVIGDLTGGISDCNVSDDQKVDYYGKLSYSWTSNGTSNSRRLKPWLDPTNTGATAIGGMDYSSSITEVAAVEDITSVSPNPAQSSLMITFEDSYQDIEVSIFDQTGRNLSNQAIPSASSNFVLDLNHLQNGLYIVRIKADGAESSHKVIVNK